SAQNHGTDVRAGDEDAFVAGRVPPRSGHAPGPWRAVRGCGSWPRVAAACRTRRTATGGRGRQGRAGRVGAPGRGGGAGWRVVAAGRGGVPHQAYRYGRAVPEGSCWTGRGAGSWRRVVVPDRGAGSWCRIVAPGRGAGSWCRIVAPGRGGPGRGRDP